MAAQFELYLLEKKKKAAKVGDAGQLFETLVFSLNASAAGVLTAFKIRWHLQISMSLNLKALWMAVSQGNIPCRLRLQMIAHL